MHGVELSKFVEQQVLVDTQESRAAQLEPLRKQLERIDAEMAALAERRRLLAKRETERRGEGDELVADIDPEMYLRTDADLAAIANGREAA
jgi:hypothetical protein